MRGVVALGLVLGSLAGLNTLGLVLLWRTTRVVNLAQSAMGLVGGVLCGMLVASAGWSFWWAAPVALGFGALLGLATDRLVLIRLQHAPRVVLLVATVGLAQVFAGIYTLLPFVFGGALPTYTVDLGFSVDVFPVLLLGPHLLALVSLPLGLLGVTWFLERSRIGLAACALGQDSERARALGVPAGLVRAACWAVAGTLATASGILSVPILGFSLGEGVSPAVLLLALAPAVLAGLRSLKWAAVAALGMGVAYQACLWYAPQAGIANIVLAVALVVALALQRQQLGRGEAARRVSSFSAATTPRPLPWSITSTPRFRIAAGVGALLAIAIAAVPPLVLSPSNDVLYATSSALALAAVAVCVAWMFAGEISLGHWGLAGLGAAVSAVAPGPWLLRTLLAGAVIAGLGALLAVASRRRSGLSFAVLGLAIAVAAPVVVLRLGETEALDPGAVGVAGGVMAMTAAMGVAWLRSTILGARLVAGRDDPQRAPWLGVNPSRSRTIALALSAALAGVAGSLYLAATPAGLAPGAFDAERSLELLSMSVIGGLGSAAGAIAGAATLKIADFVLPDAWALLASGFGVLVAVLFFPAGLSRPIAAVRAALVRMLFGGATPRDTAVAETEQPVLVGNDGAQRSWVAGSDTREASATPAVRRAATAAFFMAAPGWAAALATPAAWGAWMTLPAGLRPWLVLLLIGAAVGAGIAGWQRQIVTDDSALRDEDIRTAARSLAIVALTPAVFGLLTFATRDAVLGSLALPLVPPLAGWVIGRTARLAAVASLRWFTSAATGLVAIAALLGIVGGGHLLAVAGGSGLPRAGAWTVVYVALAAVAILRLGRDAVRDRSRLQARFLSPTDDSGEDSVLVLDRISVSFGATPVLEEATITVRAGELLALVGGNGAGKSTLLRIAAGLTTPDSGRTVVAGQDLGMLRPEERAAAGLAFVSGARPVFPDLTVLENLRVAAYRTHRTATSFDAATEAILGLVPALVHRRDTAAGLLSGGEQRLLAVAQTLYRTPTVLLADELTLGLDAHARIAVLDLLRVLASDGVAVVCVDHDLVSLLSRADRAALVVERQIREYKRPLYLLQKRADLLPATFLEAASR